MTIGHQIMNIIISSPVNMKKTILLLAAFLTFFAQPSFAQDKTKASLSRKDSILISDATEIFKLAMGTIIELSYSENRVAKVRELYDKVQERLSPQDRATYGKVNNLIGNYRKYLKELNGIFEGSDVRMLEGASAGNPVNRSQICRMFREKLAKTDYCRNFYGKDISIKYLDRWIDEFKSLLQRIESEHFKDKDYAFELRRLRSAIELPQQNPEQKPELNTERKPEQRLERKPEQRPEQKPEQNTEREPEQSPEQKPDQDEGLKALIGSYFDIIAESLKKN